MIANNASNPIPGPPPQKAVDNAPLFVALYIVMLAFFIMLNSISTIDQERVEQAVDSVSSAFSLQRDMVNVPQIFKSIGTEVSQEAFFNQIQSIASDGMPLEELEVTPYGNQMYMRFKRRGFFTVDNSIHPNMESFFLRLVDIIKDWQDKVKLEVEVLPGVSQTDLLHDNDRLYRATTQAGSIIRYLEGKNVSPDALIAGVNSLHPNDIVFRFTFKERDPLRMHVTTPEEEKPTSKATKPAAQPTAASQKSVATPASTGGEK